MSKRSGKTVRLLVSVAFVIVGGLISDLNVAAFWKPIIQNLGLSFIVTGVVSIFYTTSILHLESEEEGDVVSEKVLEKLQNRLPITNGIRMVTHARKGADAYYSWITAPGNPDLFFAGRSVLHRIDYDMKQRGKGSAEKVIAARLKAGATIRVLFLDPRSCLIERLAKESGQMKEAMLSDIANSLGICQRLYDQFLKGHRFSSRSRLEIRVYDETPYFAYHKQDDKVFVGFYFMSGLGQDSAAFETLDSETRKLFGDHFATIFSSASRLLELIPHRADPLMDLQLMEEMRTALAETLGEERTAQIMGASGDNLHNNHTV